MDNPYFVKRIIYPKDVEFVRDLWLWVVCSFDARVKIGGVYASKDCAEEQADLLNDAYQRGHDDGVAEHTAILRNATAADRDERSDDGK